MLSPKNRKNWSRGKPIVKSSFLLSPVPSVLSVATVKEPGLRCISVPSLYVGTIDQSSGRRNVWKLDHLTTAMLTPHAEMPTSRDLKSGDSLFFTSPLPWKFRTLYQVLHEVDTIQIRDYRFDARNNLCQWLNRCKMSQKPYYSYK